MAMTADTRKKAEQIARMLWQGYGRMRTARMMGMSYEGLLRITKLPEFLDIDAQIRQQVLGAQDAALAKRADVSQVRDELNNEMEDAVPEAWRVLMQNLKHKRDLRAALEILDRDPQHQFAKSTRPQQPATVGSVQVTIDSKALVQAVRDADKTHQMIERASTVKPAEA